MAATIQIHEMSAADAGADKTSDVVRFKNANDANVDSNNPMVIPDAATTYSFPKQLRAYMEAAPAVQISNMRWYSDGAGSWGTSVGVLVKNIGTTYATQATTPAIEGTADFFGKTSAAPLDGDTIDAGPFVPADDDTYIGDLILLQLSVTPSASQGSLSAETVTLAYDEI